MSAIILLAALLMGVGVVDDNAAVAHPYIPCWSGQRGWTADGELASTFVTYTTSMQEEPVSIVHDRDMIFDDGQLVQNYNFLDYRFRTGADEIRARYYLDQSNVVSVYLPGKSEKLTLEQARQVLPSGVLCYLQKRFSKIDVLLASGYVELWQHPK